MKIAVEIHPLLLLRVTLALAGGKGALCGDSETAAPGKWNEALVNSAK
jgi:hypothetical protein